MGNESVTTGKINTAIIQMDAINTELHGIHDPKSWSASLLQKLEGVDDDVERQLIVNKHAMGLEDRLAKAVTNYKKVAATMVSGSEGMANALHTAKLDMSGQFRVQIASPAIVKEFGDGQILINHNDYDTMRMGEFDENGNRSGLMSEADRKFMDSQEQLYAVTNRYPTNYSNSVGIAKLRTVGNDVVTSGEALITPGMIATMLGDADGDFLSMTLAHYDSSTYTKGLNSVEQAALRDKTLGAMGKYADAMGKEYSRVGNMLYKEMADTFQTFGLNFEEMSFTSGELKGVINAISNSGEDKVGHFNTLLSKLSEGGLLSPGHMTKEGQEKLLDIANGNQGFVNNLFESLEMTAQNTGVQEAQAFAARELRRNIGGFSNMSFKIRELGGMMQSMSEDMGLNVFTVGDMKILDSGMQLIEQKAISSKHTSKLAVEGEDPVEAARRAVQERMDKATEMKDALLNGQRKQFLDLNEELGVFKKVDAAGRAGAYQVGSAEDLFNTVEKIRNYFDRAPLGNVISSPEMNFGLSNGVYDPSDIVGLMNTPGTIMTPQLESWLKQEGKGDLVEETKSRMRAKMQFLEDNPIYNSGYASEAKFATVGSEATEAITKHIAGNLTSAPAIIGAAAFGGAWALSAMFRKGPHDKAKEDNTDANAMAMSGGMEGMHDGPYIPQADMSSPTARITPVGGGYENLQINVRANSFNGMTNDQIISMVSQELQNQSPVQMNINANTKDQSTKVDRKWVNDVVARATRYGMGF